MDFSLTEEHLMIRDAARDFAQTELLPGVIERDEKQVFPDELVKKMGLEQVSNTDELEKIIDDALVGEEENITKFQNLEKNSGKQMQSSIG